MALLSMLTKSQPFRTKLNLNGSDQCLLLVDATMNETPSYSGTLTKSPVEEGPDVNDHFRFEPISIQIEGVISESPLTFASALNLESLKSGAITSAAGFAGQKLVGGLGAQLGGLAGGFLGSRLLQASDDPAQAAFKILEEIMMKKIVMSITTKRRRYDNMMMTSLSFPRALENGKSLKFSANFQEIRIVKGETVDIKNISRSVASKAGSKTKLGNQTPTPANAEEGKKSSLLFKAMGGLFR